MTKLLMKLKIFTDALSAFLRVALICLILFIGSLNAGAVVKGWTPPEKDSLPQASKEEIGTNKATNQESIDEPSDFLDEIVFPFEPGLGN